MSTYSFAEKEFKVLEQSWDRSNADNKPVVLEFKKEILDLCKKFGESGQSGGSAPYVASAIADCVKKLFMQQPICPVTGVDDEWYNCNGIGASDIDSSQVWQNSRCSALFKDSNIQNGKPYYLDAIVWKGAIEGYPDNDWDTFTGTVEGINSRQFIKGFPFIPKKFYIDVIREELPPNHTDEPYYEIEFYDEKIYKDTGIKEWHKEKYRYKIKDPKQLERVWKYYDKFI